MFFYIKKLLIVTLVACLCGCGQKGPLYLETAYRLGQGIITSN